MYRTRQRDKLVEYMEKLNGRTFTVEEIANEEEIKGIIGKSTIYRLMAEFEKIGDVKKYHRKGQQKAVYMYTGKQDKHNHLHLKCTNCGELIHVDDSVSDKVVEIIGEQIDFWVNSKETVLFGTCFGCRREEKR